MASTCDFTTMSGEFAWVNELTQDITAGDTAKAIVANSQFHRKKTESYCREVAALS